MWNRRLQKWLVKITCATQYVILQCKAKYVIKLFKSLLSTSPLKVIFWVHYFMHKSVLSLVQAPIRIVKITYCFTKRLLRFLFVNYDFEDFLIDFSIFFNWNTIFIWWIIFGKNFMEKYWLELDLLRLQICALFSYSGFTTYILNNKNNTNSC